MGGTKVNPTYTDLGDHTETTDVDYDPSKTNFQKLLEIFWKNHDSTACNKRQYMSIIYYHDEEQKHLAEESKREMQNKTSKKIMTEILPAKTFYEAEDYHQKYILQKHPWLLTSLGVDPEDLIPNKVCARLNGYLGGYGTLQAFNEEAKELGLTEKQVNYVQKMLARGIKIDC